MDLQSDVDLIANSPEVDTILKVVCGVTGMGFAAVARVTEDRWIACAVLDTIKFGLAPGGELDVKTTICDEIRMHTTPVIIDDVSTDPQYCGHPTAAMYGFKSYISMPIFLRDKSFFGTLCAIDPNPHALKRPEVVGMFELFAKMIGGHLDAMDRLKASELKNAHFHETSALRDQFIAVLGHDLRNPLAAIGAGTTMLSKEQLSDRGTNVVALIQKSVGRMAELIDNVLDFARGRLGGGIVVDRVVDPKLGQALAQVVEESRSAAPNREIIADIAIDAPVYCSSSRIAQMLSNLIGNALHHGTANSPIVILAQGDSDRFTMSVTNRGMTISKNVADGLFQPFSRPSDGANNQGLGLGLYICAEIARAHGGTIVLDNQPDTITFQFVMPNVT